MHGYNIYKFIYRYIYIYRRDVKYGGLLTQHICISRNSSQRFVIRPVFFIFLVINCNDGHSMYPKLTTGESSITEIRAPSDARTRNSCSLTCSLKEHVKIHRRKSEERERERERDWKQRERDW